MRIGTSASAWVTRRMCRSEISRQWGMSSSGTPSRRPITVLGSTAA